MYVTTQSVALYTVTLDQLQWLATPLHRGFGLRWQVRLSDLTPTVFSSIAPFPVVSLISNRILLIEDYQLSWRSIRSMASLVFSSTSASPVGLRGRPKVLELSSFLFCVNICNHIFWSALNWGFSFGFSWQLELRRVELVMSPFGERIGR